MAWGWFTLALVLTFLLQTTVAPFCLPDWLDLMVVLALVVGLTAPAGDARLAGWLVGFSQDLDSGGPLGLHALLLGLAVLGLTHLRELINLHLWWGRWLIALLVTLPLQLLLQLHLRLPGGDWVRIGVEALSSAAVAALLAALLVGVPGLLGRRRRRLALRW